MIILIVGQDNWMYKYAPFGDSPFNLRHIVNFIVD